MGVLVILIKLVVLLIMVLVSVPFIIIIERKVLGYIQVRKGPNKFGFKGVAQPFSDAMKLFSKEVIVMNFISFVLYLLSPVLALFLMFMIWMSFPSFWGMGELVLGSVYVLCCLSVGVYPSLIAGWSSNSKYSYLGGLRSVAQTVSYEVSMVMIFLSFIVLVESYSLDDVLNLSGMKMFVVSLPLVYIWFVSMLVELNRSPFDLSEGESELVSGFNTEYEGGGFALFFLAEYGMILFFSFFFSFFFLGGDSFFLFKSVLIFFFVVWIRGVVPRIRYDQLMSMAWKVFLPVSVFYFMFWVGLGYLIIY